DLAPGGNRAPQPPPSLRHGYASGGGDRDESLRLGTPARRTSGPASGDTLWDGDQPDEVSLDHEPESDHSGAGDHRLRRLTGGPRGREMPPLEWARGQRSQMGAPRAPSIVERPAFPL